MINYEKLAAYRRGIRPVLPDSFPQHADKELDRVAQVTNQLLQAIQDLNLRVTDLETP